MLALEEEFKEFLRFKQFQQLKKNSLTLVKESSGINYLNGSNSPVHVNGDHSFDEIEQRSNYKCFNAHETANNYQNHPENCREVYEHELEEYNINYNPFPKFPKLSNLIHFQTSCKLEEEKNLLRNPSFSPDIRNSSKSISSHKKNLMSHL